MKTTKNSDKLGELNSSCIDEWEVEGGIFHVYSIQEVFGLLFEHPFCVITETTSFLLDKNYNTDDLFEYRIKKIT